MELEHGEPLAAVFDGYQLITETRADHTKTLANHTERLQCIDVKIESHDIQIQVID